LHISGTQTDRFEKKLIFNGRTNRKKKMWTKKIVPLESETTTLHRKLDLIFLSDIHITGK